MKAIEIPEDKLKKAIEYYTSLMIEEDVQDYIVPFLQEKYNIDVDYAEIKKLHQLIIDHFQI